MGTFRENMKVHRGLHNVEIVHEGFQGKRDDLWKFIVL